MIYLFRKKLSQLLMTKKYKEKKICSCLKVQKGPLSFKNSVNEKYSGKYLSLNICMNCPITKCACLYFSFLQWFPFLFKGHLSLLRGIRPTRVLSKLENWNFLRHSYMDKGAFHQKSSKSVKVFKPSSWWHLLSMQLSFHFKIPVWESIP